MTRDWQPGDVAMTIGGRVMLVEGEGRGTMRWQWADGSTLPADHDAMKYGVHPLAVIDPENREQVDDLCKALVEAMHKAGDVASAANGVHPATVALALREFADPKPPKPDEPTGLGAVVEDDEGRRFVRRCLPGDGWSTDWSSPDASMGDTFRWADIEAVRVLSEGVQ